MSAAGIIFSNIHDNNLKELTRLRTIASVPFGCRYRLIDFTLSNMVNSNIYNINVITHYNYHSLMDHIGAGKDWDLARRSGGIKILPPFITAYANNAGGLYTTRLEALKSINYSIDHITDEYIVMSDCDVLCNIDLNDIINNHIKNDADITIAVKQMDLTPEKAKINVLYTSDESGRINDVLAYPTNYSGMGDVSLNIVVMKRDYLRTIVLDAIAHDYRSFTRDIIQRNCGAHNYRVYKYDGYFACITSFAEYFRYNMALISDDEARKALFGIKSRPIYTKVRNSAPTYYDESSAVTSSIIADGCTICGKVENSILFRGVKIGKNTTVRNSILFQDTYTGENVFLNCVVSDKNTVIRDGRILSGHESQPYYIDKGKMI